MPEATNIILASTPTAKFIAERKNVFSGLIPSGSVDPAQWWAAAMIEVNQLPSDVQPDSVKIALLNAAYLGLQFGRSLGHAFLVPLRDGNKPLKRVELWQGYKGVTHLAFETGFLSTLHCDVVCEGEVFEYWKDETGPRLKHIPRLERTPDRKNILAVYVIYQTKDGGKGITVTPRSSINKSDKNRDVWLSDYHSMVLKTGILRARREWNLTSRMAHAAYIDEQTERDEVQALPPGLEVIEAKPSSFTLPTGAPAVIESQLEPVVETPGDSESVKAWRVTIGFCDTQPKLDKLYLEYQESHGDLSHADELVVAGLFDDAAKRLLIPY